MANEEQKTIERLDLEAVREKLAGKQGVQYWRGLEEVAETPEFQAWLEDEFPNRRSLADLDRRSLLKYMGASLALAGLSGCRGYFMPAEKVVPYVRQPEELVIGKPLFYASAFPHAGYGLGVLVEQREGRPIKIEGNPEHPETRGTSNVFMQAAILSLYDPERARSVQQGGMISTWEEFYKAMRTVLREQKAKNGAGIRILTETSTSPTLESQMAEFRREFPGAQWHSYEAFGRTAAHQGAAQAFGRPLNTVYDFRRANVVVSLDSDFLHELPGSLKYAKDFMDQRRVIGDRVDMNRLYVIESTPTITGANADHRWGVKPSQVEAVAFALLGVLEGTGAAGVSGVTAAHLEAIVRDLQANRGASVVVPGENQPPVVHAVVHRINQLLGNNGATVFFTEPIEVTAATRSLAELAADLNAGAVDVLLVIGGNPVFDAPADLNFGEAMKKAKLKVRYGYYEDETTALADWSVPATHFLEEWSDVRAFDGTVSIVQPLTMPLFEGRSIHEVLSAILNRPMSGYDRVRQTWRARGFGGANFEAAWRKAVHDGIVPNTAAPKVAATVVATPAPSAAAASGVEIAFRPDYHLWDGRYANNGWLMELPRPLTKLVWDNAAQMSPKMAQQLGVQTQDMVEITVGNAKVTAPVWVEPGHPEETVTLHAGFGRTMGATIAHGQGFNVYPLRTTQNSAYATGVQVRKIDGTYVLASTQMHHSMEGRDIIRLGTIEEYRTNPSLYKGKHEKDSEYIRKKSLYPDEIFSFNGPQWGMVIDLNTCIGCNACAIACQAENNIPVVGKVEVKRGREMHWLRIDRYYSSDALQEDPIENPRPVFQPMMCVHCEKAPCEPVCPVAATVHSHDGLNQMVYNRCVGTRYCSNNCPYKVRRFNYFNYTDNQPNFSDKVMDLNQPDSPVRIPGPINKPKNDVAIPLLQMLNNPDVTVRGRGVMEKCTYCTQRISQVRIEAKKQGRDPLDGEILTACQQACPTAAIVFGNIADKEAQVSKLRNDRRSYLLMEELQTRPRTSYLGRLTNPNPEIQA